MPRIGLVTVLFNSDEVLEGFFKSLSSQTFKDYYLYLIDNTPNGKTDFLIKQLTERFPVANYSHISNSQNLGVAKGNNQGIERSLAQGCTHTLLLNNDIEFEQDFLLKEMYQYATSNNEAIIVPKIYFYDTRKIWLAGGKFRKNRGTVHHVGIGDNDGPSYNKPGYFDYAPTCFMLINHTVFESIGLMDERYFVYYDDTDFIYRAVQKGFKVFYMPSLEVLHKVSNSTGGGESLFSIYYATRNRIYFLRKNFKGIQKINAMNFTLLTRGLRYLSYGKKQRAEMIRALKDGFGMELFPKGDA